MLNPKFAVLDEIDSGLDIDALRVVGGENVNAMVNESFRLYSNYTLPKNS